MFKTIQSTFFVIFIIEGCLAQIEIEANLGNHLRLLKNKLKPNTSDYATSLKIHSKLLQTVYSESFSKNYYYTTLYVGPDKIKQTYIIDTGNSMMSSPCEPCEKCGRQKNNYFYKFTKKDKPLKCDTKVCNMVPATNCVYKKDKDNNKKLCSFDIKGSTGDGIKGYYLSDIVYFETDTNSTFLLRRPLYRSYALPIGCTTEEYGKYKDLNVDGIMGVNNDEKSFISLLYNLKIINRNIFSLCFGLRGGYMSLGEIDSTYHRSKNIDYVPLLTSDIFYLIKVKGISVGNNKKTIYSKSDASIDTGNTISYFPSYLYKSLIDQFNDYCQKQGGRCGEFKNNEEYGYCASFQDRESLFKAIYEHWPNITLILDKDKEYVWKPIHYYYYYLNGNHRKACLGFNSHKSQNIILGTNFIHGHDIIFDRTQKQLGFVSADCSRGNALVRRVFRHYHLSPIFDKDPLELDKEIHKAEKEGKFNLGDNVTNDMLDFIQGHNTELDFSSDFRLVNFIILLISIIIVVVVLIVVISALVCNKRGYLQYDNPTIEYAEEDNENISGDNDKKNLENNNTLEDTK